MSADKPALLLALDAELREFADVLQNELDRGAEIATARRSNYNLIKLVIEQPALHPNEYAASLAQDFETAEHYTHSQLHANRLYTPGKRRRISQILRTIGQNASALLLGTSTNVEPDFGEIARIIRAPQFFERKIESKGFLCTLHASLFASAAVSLKGVGDTVQALEQIATSGSYKLCRELARRIVDIVGTEYGLERRKTASERVRDVLSDVALTRDEEDMRATLLIVQREAEHLRTQFEGEVQGRTQEFVRDFFAQMNSVRHSNLLDSVALTDSLISQKMAEGWKIEPALQAIPTIIQVLMNYLRSHGVFPIEEIGKVREIRGSELSAYKYEDADPPSSDELIRIVVRTPGWRFNDYVISPPRVGPAGAERHG